MGRRKKAENQYNYNIFKNDDDEVKKIIFTWKGLDIAFGFENYQAVRADACKKASKSIPVLLRSRMKSEANEIYWKSLKKESLHQKSWPKKEQERLDALSKYKCEAMTRGFLKIYRNGKKGKTIEMFYHSIDAAIRGQAYIISIYQKQLSLNGNESEEQLKLHKHIAFFRGRVDALIAEKRNIAVSIFFAILRLSAMLNSKNDFFEGKGFHIRLAETLAFLDSVWLNPFFGPAQDCKTLLLSAQKKSIKQKKEIIDKTIQILHPLLMQARKNMKGN